jgi:hypothetical protein
MPHHNTNTLMVLLKAWEPSARFSLWEVQAMPASQALLARAQMWALGHIL